QLPRSACRSDGRLPRCPRRPLSSLYPVVHPTLPSRNPSSSRSTVQTLPSPCASSPLLRSASPRPPRSRIQRRLRSTSRRRRNLPLLPLLPSILRRMLIG
ncbi:unnamed protein product, partial [Musa banksii]